MQDIKKVNPDHTFYWTWLQAVLANPPDPALGFILIKLGSMASHKDGSRCWPGVETLARECRCDVRTMRRALAKLEAMGWIKREEKKGRTNTYILTPGVLVTPDKSVTPGVLVTPDKSVRGGGVAMALDDETFKGLAPQPLANLTGGANCQGGLANLTGGTGKSDRGSVVGSVVGSDKDAGADEAHTTARPVEQGQTGRAAMAARPVMDLDFDLDLAAWLELELEQRGWTAPPGSAKLCAAALERSGHDAGAVRAYCQAKLTALEGRATRMASAGVYKALELDAATALRAASRQPRIPAPPESSGARQEARLTPSRAELGAATDEQIEQAKRGALAWLYKDGVQGE